MDRVAMLARARRVAGAARRRLRERRDPLFRLISRAARQSDDRAWDAMWDDRRSLVRRLASGKTFLDLGGMFGVDGEMAFLAEEAGARRVVLFDAMDPTPPFEEMHRTRRSAIQFFQGDLHDPSLVDDLGTFEVVWCTGVVYHSPHPILQLQQLRRLTTETLVLGSLVIPEMPGIEQACVLYPGISPRMQRVFADVYGGATRFPGMSVPFDETRGMAYANMWWGITPSALLTMLRFTGFDVVDHQQRSPFNLDVVARTGGVSPDIYPPLEQSRERVRRRLATEQNGDVPDYARDQANQLGFSSRRVL